MVQKGGLFASLGFIKITYQEINKPQENSFNIAGK